MIKPKTIVLLIISSLFFTFLLPIANQQSVSAITTSSAGGSGGSCDGSQHFFGFPAWYRGVTKIDSDGNCVVEFTGNSDDIGPFIWKIVLNVIEIALRIIGIVTAGYILYGGFSYLTANGSPDKAAKGLNLIMSASIGLIISIASIGIINKLFEIIPAGTAAVDGIYKLEAAEVLSSVLSIVYWIAGAVAVIMIIIAGIRFITSGGNPSGLQKARSSLIYSVTGLVVIIIAFTITNVILGFFK